MGVELRHQIPPDEDDGSPREGRMGDRIADFVLAPTIRILPPGSELIYTRSSEALSF